MKGSQVKKGAGDGATKEAKEAKRKQQLSVKDQKAKKRQARKDRKAKKDPNKPKRPPTAFFIFLEEFRKAYKVEHPDVKGVTAVGKACGDKWKEMSEQEKAPYVLKATQKRAEFEKSLAAYNLKSAGGAPGGYNEDEGTGEESEKSKSEINDDDEDSEEEEED